MASDAAAGHEMSPLPLGSFGMTRSQSHSFMARDSACVLLHDRDDAPNGNDLRGACE